MVKKLPTKDDMRADLEREMSEFLQKGGSVNEVPTGTSGKDASQPPTYLAGRLFTEPAASRTYVPEVVAAIEARRTEKLKHPAKKIRSRPPRQRRKVIYDDFGEPLRKVWVDE